MNLSKHNNNNNHNNNNDNSDKNSKSLQAEHDAEYRPTKAQDHGLMPRADVLYYFSKHRTAGCKITHMIGVPMIVASIMLLPFGSKKRALTLFGLGWIFQFVGHYAFEHNKPVFLEMRSIPTGLAALLFVLHQWQRLIAGKGIVRS